MPHTDDSMAASDNVQVAVTPGAAAPRKAYTVIAASGLFKNGKQHPTGTTVELDERTAANFLAAGDIEEIEA